jgi:peptidoglycan/xylan/chitin deacetylase (PgdA/CDA1 family)
MTRNTIRKKLASAASVLRTLVSSSVNGRIVAGMATLPSRAATLPAALRSIVHQVDRLYLYLDGHQEVPEAARNDVRVIPIFSRDEPNLASGGKFLGLIREPERCLYVSTDDDIVYPPDYVARLAGRLSALGSRAIVGVHGVILRRPLASYLRDREVFHFADALYYDRAVNVLGTGTMMFDTAVFRFDVRNLGQLNMTDLNVAVEAARSGLPMICVARMRNFLLALEEGQSGSIYSRLEKDDSRQTSRALELLALLAAKGSSRRGPNIEIFAMHGIADGVRDDLFQHRNLLDAGKFTALLRTGPKFVPLADALQGRGRALTIDDATVASARAAKLAREFGHAVTLFVNPWQIEARQPYWFSRLNSLLDRVEAPTLVLDGRDFDLTTVDAKSQFRAHVKTLMRQHIVPEQSTALIEKIEAAVGALGDEIPNHNRCLDIEDLRKLHGAGIDIQNHYWSHLDPLAHNLTQFTEEFHKAGSWLKDKLAIDSRCFASPFGEFLPHLDFLRRQETVCLLLHNDLPSGCVEDCIVNRITLQA